MCPFGAQRLLSGVASAPSVDTATQKLFDAGNAFEARVYDRLGETAGAVVLSDDDGWDPNIERTVAAMRSGAPLIVNGRLPRGLDGRGPGRPGSAGRWVCAGGCEAARHP